MSLLEGIFRGLSLLCSTAFMHGKLAQAPHSCLGQRSLEEAGNHVHSAGFIFSLAV